MSELTTERFAGAIDREERARRNRQARAESIFRENLLGVFQHRDHVFAWLMAIQWLFALVVAAVYSPYAWSGKVFSTNVHVYTAAVLGGAISLPVILLARFRPGWVVTRHAAAISQTLWSALLIHLTGGRIETHFHVFGSLAYLAFYRDWTVILSGTIVVAGDHLLRGIYWSESVYGITNPEWWRFLEHAFWVVFEDIVLVMGIAQNRKEMRELAYGQCEMEELNSSIEQQVMDRTRELETSREQYRSLTERTKSVPWQMDANGWRYLYVGPQGAHLLACPVDDWMQPGFWEARLHPDDKLMVLEAYGKAVEAGADQEVEFRLRRNDGSLVWVRSLVTMEKRGDVCVLQGLLLDTTEQRQLEVGLRQAQKLESVGRLAAGVAHEINTPVQFVNDNVHFVKEAVVDLEGVLEKYKSVLETSLGGEAAAHASAAVAKVDEEADLTYLLENLPKALDRSIEGLGRVAAIVRSMKEFAHPDQKEMVQVNLNQAILSTLTVASNEYKYVADVETDLAEIPLVLCHAGDINQVVLNLVVNAAHAIGDVVAHSGARGRLTVRTGREDEHVLISISDTGTGIPLEIQNHVFDPFFTTKEVGKGTGQGLAIARQVVIDKHGGSITFETEVGKGTTFFVRLPIAGKRSASLVAA